MTKKIFQRLSSSTMKFDILSRSDYCHFFFFFILRGDSSSLYDFFPDIRFVTLILHIAVCYMVHACRYIQYPGALIRF